MTAYSSQSVARERTRAAVGRAITPALLILVIVLLPLPFVSVGCDERATYQGIDLIEGDLRDFDREGEDSEVESVLTAGAMPMTLAVVFAGLGALIGLLPGLVAASFAFAAATTTAAMLAALFLSASLRGEESVFVDLRHGFWIAMTLATAAAVAGWLRWQAYPRLLTAWQVLPAYAGVVLLVGAALTPWPSLAPDSGGFFGTGLSAALAPGERRSGVWQAVGLAGAPFVAFVCVLVLLRERSRLAGWAVAGLGAGWGVLAAATFGSVMTSNGAFGDGAYLALVGGAALVFAGVAVGRDAATGSDRAARRVRLLVTAGAAAAIAATLLPAERGAGARDATAIFYGPGHDRWAAVQPIVVAVLALAALWLLPRARAAALAAGLALTMLFAFLPLMDPLFDREYVEEDLPETAASLVGPAGFVGIAGAALMLAAAAWLLRQEQGAGAD